MDAALEAAVVRLHIVEQLHACAKGKGARVFMLYLGQMKLSEQTRMDVCAASRGCK